jgi:acyl-CoA synthetase (AMP-forming)/AMP-acid ligase II
MTELLIGDVLRISAARRPDGLAVSLGHESLTYAQLEARADAIANALLTRGVGRGDRVAWQAETSVNAVALYFAAALIGAMFTPLNPRATKNETDILLAQSDPAIVLGDAPSGHLTIAALLDAVQGKSPSVRPEVLENDGQVIFYTSGTTGTPKGCILSHRAQRLRAGNGSPWPQGATVCMFPQFHMASWMKSLEAWVSSSHVVMVERPDAENLIDAIERHRAGRLYCIPAVWRRILDADRGGRDLSSLRFIETGTSSTSPQFLRDLGEAFPEASISVTYGSTEAGAVCVLGPDDIHRKPGSVGLACPTCEVRLGDDSAIMVRSPSLFSGYFRNPAATEAAFVDGWYRSGDVAVRDEEQCYRIVGRVDDLIRTGGETVAPAEVEAAIQSHPNVAEAAVAGVLDDTWGQIVTAFVVLRPDAVLTLDELREHAAAYLAIHKRPRKLVIVDAIPRTGATGQIQRKRLLESVAREPVASAAGPAQC